MMVGSFYLQILGLGMGLRYEEEVFKEGITSALLITGDTQQETEGRKKWGV